MRKIIVALILLGLLGFTNLYLPKYASLPYWFNQAMHFLGGFFSGFLCGAIMAYLLDLRKAGDKSLRFMLIGLAIFFGAVALGAMWEEYEFYFISRKTLSEWTWLSLYDDTLIDMKMNRRGASAALALFTVWQLLKRVAGLFRK